MLVLFMRPGKYSLTFFLTVETCRSVLCRLSPQHCPLAPPWEEPQPVRILSSLEALGTCRTIIMANFMYFHLTLCKKELRRMAKIVKRQNKPFTLNLGTK